MTNKKYDEKKIKDVSLFHFSTCQRPSHNLVYWLVKSKRHLASFPNHFSCQNRRQNKKHTWASIPVVALGSLSGLSARHFANDKGVFCLFLNKANMFETCEQSSNVYETSKLLARLYKRRSQHCLPFVL